MAHFASGKYALAICDICGIRCRYRDLRGTTIRGRPTGFMACPTCWDPDHPQNFLPEVIAAAGVDAQALRDPRPDTGLAASRQLYPNANWPPFPEPAGRDQPSAFKDPNQNAGGTT